MPESIAVLPDSQRTSSSRALDPGLESRYWEFFTEKQAEAPAVWRDVDYRGVISRSLEQGVPFRLTVEVVPALRGTLQITTVQVPTEAANLRYAPGEVDVRSLLTTSPPSILKGVAMGGMAFVVQFISEEGSEDAELARFIQEMGALHSVARSPTLLQRAREVAHAIRVKGIVNVGEWARRLAKDVSDAND